ncbi:MAG TPA: PQQ-dependent dehydrogenase, methanol/ethanol family [Gemmatimonadales bacterium]|nr:PQQ-dependent dehydrogenase, methanol/ethanol family [Gemmatimonadales bacterium]
MNIRLLALALVSAAPLAAQVSQARLTQSRHEPGNWFTYSGDLGGQRYSPLTQITATNVGSLRAAWIYQAGDAGLMQTTPVVVDGVMYLTEFHGHVVALDARTGRVLWRYQQQTPAKLLTLGFGPTNRGIAILDSTVYVGTPDARLVALDARSGALRWSVPVADNAAGYSITAAPLAVRDMIIVGISGAEAGIRGFLDAYDARSGKRRWRLYTIPAAGEPGVETWGGESYKTGGGSTWVTGSYDPALGLIYWGVGNPGPDWNGDARPGDNLYTCSLLAIDAATGTLKWHFQFTPHDTHDWDATEIPVLFDGTYEGKPRRFVAMANRNGFYYLLDRVSGQFLTARDYIHQEWTAGIDSTGRPRPKAGIEPTDSGTALTPNLHGGTNWYSPSYSPKAGLFYVAARQMGSKYFKYPASYTPGRYFMGGGEAEVGGDLAAGAVKALDPLTGAERWAFPLHSPPWAGLLSTGGGVVFGGTNEGQFFALDGQSGKPLWNFMTGGWINANPMSYAVDGRQYVAMASGPTLMVFALPAATR